MILVVALRQPGRLPDRSRDYIRSVHIGKNCYQPPDCNPPVVVLYNQLPMH